MQPARWIRPLRLIVGSLLLLIAFQSVVAACPSCKDAISQQDPHHAGIVRGYFISILFMMSMPFLIFTGLTTYFCLEVRNARLRAAQGVPIAS